MQVGTRVAAALGFVGWFVTGFAGGAVAADDGVIEFRGACDGSAAVFLRQGALMVANDRSDVLHVYHVTGGQPKGSIDLHDHTTTSRYGTFNHSDFEGAARQGDMIYFITSHARDRKGRNRSRWRRLIALQATPKGLGEDIQPHGKAYTDLKYQMTQSKVLRPMGIHAAIMELHKQLEHLAPEQRGLNIEGLAAGQDGQSLLMGLRNPRRGVRAMVIPLLNPDRVVIGYGEPEFGQVLKLDLGGHGITSMDLDPEQGDYLIIASPHDREGEARLYRWGGTQEAKPELLMEVSPSDFAAQGLAISPSGRVMILSDDGHLRVPVDRPDQCVRKPDEAGTCVCNEVTHAPLKRFRGRWVDLPDGASSAP